MSQKMNSLIEAIKAHKEFDEILNKYLSQLAKLFGDMGGTVESFESLNQSLITSMDKLKDSEDEEEIEVYKSCKNLSGAIGEYLKAVKPLFISEKT